jgi:hypothetical protein
MIRSWIESHIGRIWRRIDKATDKSGLYAEVKSDWMQVLYVLGVILMTAGLVSAVITPVNFGYIIFPSSGAQSATETGVDALTIAIGAVGIYMSYLSGRQTTKSRMVNFLLGIGLLLIAIAVYMGIYVLSQK